MSRSPTRKRQCRVCKRWFIAKYLRIWLIAECDSCIQILSEMISWKLILGLLSITSLPFHRK
ncbi:MAG: hypothetical protein PVI62_17615 [Desulfobacterales bacterium]